MIDSNLTTDVEVLVVGAGQAGLAAGMAVRQTGLRFLIMDAGDQPGRSWPLLRPELGRPTPDVGSFGR